MSDYCQTCRAHADDLSKADAAMMLMDADERISRERIIWIISRLQYYIRAASDAHHPVTE